MNTYDRAILKSIILEILTEVLTGNSVNPSTDRGGWVDLKSAVDPLGYPSYKSLYGDVVAGLLRDGKEIRDRRKPGAKISRYQINIEAAQKRLSESHDRRRSVHNVKLSTKGQNHGNEC